MNKNFLFVFFAIAVIAVTIVVGNTFTSELSQNSTDCFTTPSMNEFCYPDPVMHETGGLSKIIGSDADSDDGEVHFDNVDTGTFYYSIKNMQQVSDGDDATITFGDKDGYVGGSSTVSESFEFFTTLEKFDTFVSHCNNEEGTNVNVVQYIGIETIGNTDYFVTWHTGVDLEEPITCKYPELIQNSMSRNFGI